MRASDRKEQDYGAQHSQQLPGGEITEAVKGEAAARVSIRVGDNQMTALIARESADELGLEPGQQVTVLVKAADVMISTGDDIA